MKRFLGTLISALVLALTACGSPTAQADPEQSEVLAAPDDINLTVFAAASLQNSFAEISAEFTAKHPHVSINFNFAGSSTLVQNLEAGAPADIFASADETNMDKAQESELIVSETRNLFAANSLVGIVPADNPANISSLEEANADDMKLVVCAPQVPCGALAKTLAEAADITLNPVSEEQQVSDVLGKVRSGEADAGLVYATDAVLAPDEVTVFEIAGASDHLNYYPIARTADAESVEVADEFLAFIHSSDGQTILETNGFLTP